MAWNARLPVVPAVVLSLLVWGCGETQVPSGPITEHGNLEPERLSLEREWRDGVVLPGEGWRQISFGEIPERGLLRYSVYGEGTLHIRVFAGGRMVEETVHSELSKSASHRISLEQYAGTECVLNVEAAGTVWLSSAELFVSETARPNVLVLLADTLRPDFLRCYGFPLETSPAIDAFAADAVLFRRLISPSSWTRPSVATLFTSTPANIHKVFEREDVLRDDIPNVFGLLGGNGYEVQAFITNPNCLPYFGFGRGLQRLVDTETETGRNGWVEDEYATGLAVEAIHNAAGRPWAIYLHLMGPHKPYDPPQEFVDKFMPNHFIGSRPEQRVQRDKVHYAAEVLKLDGQFARVMNALKETGVYDDTLIVFLSDHGEQFQEHGESAHAKSLFDEEVRVPLIVKLPGNAHAGARRDGVVRMEDIAPTLLEMLEHDVPDSFEGSSFEPILRGEPEDPRIATGTLRFDGRLLHMARSRDHKFIHDSVRGEDRWYRLLEDQREIDPLRSAPPGAENLREIAMEAALRDAPGLHVRTEGDAQHTVEIRGAGDDAPTITAGELESRGEVLRWNVTGPARLHVLAPDSALRVEMDGVTVNVADNNATASVWYVQPAARKTIEPGDGELHEALEALGYIQ